MIVVSGTVEIAAEDIGAATDAMRVMMAETAKEDGCIVYRFYPDIELEGHFRVYEEWESEAALKAHFNVPHMAAFREALGKIKVLSRDIKMFPAGEATSL